MLKTILVLILVGSAAVHAEGKVIAWEDWQSPRCRVSWQYEDANFIAGFRLYRMPDTNSSSTPKSGVQTIADPAARELPCTNTGITKPGQVYLALSAYDDTGLESVRSTVLAFKLAPPGIRAPHSVQIILAP